MPKFNKELAILTNDITEGTKGVIRSHSFRSRLSTEMGLAGFSDEQIIAVRNLIFCSWMKWNKLYDSFISIFSTERHILHQRQRS